MKSCISDAVTRLLTDFDDFWLLAGMADLSFEDGGRSRPFRRAVEAYARAGLVPSLCRDLDEGINGNLKKVLEANAPGLVVERRKSKSLDLIVSRHGACEAIIEAKHMWDMAWPWRVPERMRNDQKKLRREKSGYPGAEALHIVWFVQLPKAYYPAGTWYGEKRLEPRGEDRTLCVQYPLVALQYESVGQALRLPATWPSPDGPLCHAPELSVAVSRDCVAACFGAMFRPDDSSWVFEPEKYFEDASVGVAIWEY